MSIKSENYILIPGWASSKLLLKGNDLMVYSIIYGFTQEEGQWYKGSLKYLAEWTNSTHQGIMKNLKNLVSYGYIIREDHEPTNWYRANLAVIRNLLTESTVNSVKEDVNLVNTSVNSVTNDGKQCLQNNIINNIKKDNNNYKLQVELNSKIEEIISYFNKTCNTNFKSNTAATKRLIKARLNEGFTIDDFKKVIDHKYNVWGKTPVKFSNGQMSNEYLRPSTLFGNKFESYIYEASIIKESSEGYIYNSSTSSEVDKDVSGYSF